MNLNNNNLPYYNRDTSGKNMFYGLTAVGFLALIFYIAIVYPTIPESMTAKERYNNFGSVGSKLTGNLAPQEYQAGIAVTNPAVKNTGNEVLDPSDIPKSASSAITASSAVVLADMNTSKARIETPTTVDGAEREGNIMEDIKYATKGDGQIRPVAVNQTSVDNDFVKLAMFENQDFMYRLQTPIKSTPHLQDPSIGQPKSMFRKMTYPLVFDYFSRSNLGMDVIQNKDDVRATISFTGGRPPTL